jgi:hypothetical protein
MQINLTTTLRNLHARAASISEVVLLAANGGLALLVCIAHGGALLAIDSLPQPHPQAGEIRRLAMFTLPLASCVVLTALAALLLPAVRRQVLAAQAWTLAAGTLALWGWAASVLLAGIPRDAAFSWTPGLLTASVVYTVWLFCRYGLPARLRERDAVLYAPFFALLAAAIVDIGVFIRLLMMMADLFDRWGR